MNYELLPGRSFPLGATPYPDGVNFSVFSAMADAVELLLFEDGNYAQPLQVLPFHRVQNRSGFYWHMFVPNLRAGQVYAYRVYGPFEPVAGNRFDGSKVLIDPYSKA